MTFEAGLAIGEAGIIVVLASLLVWVVRTSAAERRELYGRIQAGTLADYVAHIEPPAAPEPARGDIADDDRGNLFPGVVDHGAWDPDTLADADAEVERGLLTLMQRNG